MQIAILRLKKMVVHISIGTMTLLNLVTFALQVYFQIRGIHSAGESLTGDGIPFQYLAGRFFMFIISFLLLFRIVILLWLRYSVPQLRMEEYREKRVQLRRLTLFSVISLFIGPCVSLVPFGLFYYSMSHSFIYILLSFMLYPDSLRHYGKLPDGILPVFKVSPA